jgi:hypothetical protein
MAQMIQTIVCPKSPTASTDLFGQLFACQPETNGFSDFTIEAVDGAVHSFSGSRAPTFTGEGQVEIHLSNK